MRVVPIPLNVDNYGYLLIDTATNDGAVVDVSGQPEKVLEVAKKEGVNLIKVLTTHKHWDHAGGNNVIKERLPNIEIVGSSIDNVEGCTKFVADNEEFTLSGINIKCLLTPGHTNGHISYVATSNHNNDDEKVVFTGDCLFVGGCGRFFEGTSADMFGALQKLTALPKDTKVYCGHEYTAANYKFALSVDQRNTDLINENVSVQLLRKDNLPTIPTTIGKELKTNPFLRVNEQDICNSCNQGDDPITVLGCLREMKNNFK